MFIMPGLFLRGRRQGKALLQQSDFTYLGYYRTSGQFKYAAAGLKLRNTSTIPTFLLWDYDAGRESAFQLTEHAIPSQFGPDNVNYTDVLSNTSIIRRWQAPTNNAYRIFYPEPSTWRTYMCGTGAFSDGGGFNHQGAWIENDTRLWHFGSIDYPDDDTLGVTQGFTLSTLNNDGTVSNVSGVFGLTGRSSRNFHGGACAIPAWFQSAYGVGPYAVGFGGYASRQAQSITEAALGLQLFAIPDPADYSPGNGQNTFYNFTAGSEYKILADVGRAFGTSTWNAILAGTNTSDRGSCPAGTLEANHNHCDDDGVPFSGTAPDGRGRWGWPSVVNSTGLWIDTDTKHGFIIIPSITKGRTWYNTEPDDPTRAPNGANRPYSDYKTYELQVFDPTHFGDVVLGSRSSWNVKPVATKILDSDFPSSECMWGFNGELDNNRVIGADYDPVTKRLYVHWEPGASGAYGGTGLILVYSVNI